MKRVIATATLAIGVFILALSCDCIGYEFAGGAILFLTGLAIGYCVTVKEEAE